MKYKCLTDCILGKTYKKRDKYMFIAIGLVVVLILVAILTYNSIVKANVGVDEAFSQIDVQLKRRADLIPNLVTTVQGYAAHEKSTLDAVVAARAKATSATGVADTAAADGMLTQALRGLLAVAEAYPDLKASANFLSLQEELSSTENKVAFARQFYNDQVRVLNSKILVFPTSVFASMLSIKEREFYEVEIPEDRNPPKVTF